MNNFQGQSFERGPKGRTETYIQPTKDWRRIGLKVDNKYANSKWLMMDNNPDEWYVAYHGIKVPNMHQVLISVMRQGLMEGWA